MGIGLTGFMHTWPDNPAYNQGADLFDAGHFVASVVAFQRAITLQPRRARIYTNHARALAACGRLDEAGDAAERGVSLAEPGDLYPFAQLAWIWEDQGRHAEIAEIAERLLQHGSWTVEQRIELVTARVIALVHDGDSHQAVLVAQREAAHAKEPRFFDAYAMALVGQERWGEALAAVQRSRGHGADTDRVVHRIRAIEQMLQAMKQKLQRAEEGIAQTPEAWEAHHELGRILFQCGELERAETAFAMARRLHPDDLSNGGILSKQEMDCMLALATRRYS
ncbi:MAG: tetratricopeptide repeat protein [Myxococcota bacterium]